MLKDHQDKGPPSCYGKMFSAKETDCIGGYDPTWDGPGHVRPACDYADSCAARGNTQTQNIVPAQNLVRPQTTFQPRTTFSRPTTSNPPPFTGRPPGSPPPFYQPQHVPPPMPGNQQHVGVQQSYSANFGIPQYLTVREPVNSGSPMKRLGVETARSVGKSIGHTIAHFFDVEILGHENKPK